MSDTKLLLARANRFASDLLVVAAPAPARPVSDGILMVYTELRAALAEELSDEVIGALPRFGAGAQPTHGDLAIYAGQLAELANASS